MNWQGKKDSQIERKKQQHLKHHENILVEGDNWHLENHEVKPKDHKSGLHFLYDCNNGMMSFPAATWKKHYFFFWQGDPRDMDTVYFGTDICISHIFLSEYVFSNFIM